MAKKHYHPRLPNEILTEIFSRVPAKTVGKFMCLSKPWYGILSASYFINLHVSRKTHQQSLILLTPSKSLHVMKLPIENPTILKKLELENTWTEVLGSCNGLVLLLNTRHEMFLVNPTTLEQLKVPKIPLVSELSDFLAMRGLGYDKCSDDYKILVVCPMHSDSDDNELYPTFLYSIKYSVWRRINHSLPCIFAIGTTCGTFANGSIHWHVNRIEVGISTGVLAFNLATEVFYEVDTPLSFCNMACRLFAGEGRLCALNMLVKMGNVSNHYGKVDVWVMKEYGMSDSWTKLGTFEGHRINNIPLYFGRDEEIMLIAHKNTLVVCNLVQGTLNKMIVDGVTTSFSGGCSFVESLVSLKGVTSPT